MLRGERFHAAMRTVYWGVRSPATPFRTIHNSDNT
jgi:hypothetical protein